MLVQLGAVPNLHHFAGFFHGSVPGQLPLRLGPRLLRRIPAGQFVEIWRVAANLRCHAQTDIPAAHFRKAHRVIAAVHPVFHGGFPTPDLLQRPPQVAVPLQRVHGKIEVHIENQGGCSIHGRVLNRVGRIH